MGEGRGGVGAGCKMYPAVLVRQLSGPEIRSFRMFLVGNWKSAVLQKIDADQLPVHWGGTQTDPDGDIYCRSKVTLMIKCIMFREQ